MSGTTEEDHQASHSRKEDDDDQYSLGDASEDDEREIVQSNSIHDQVSRTAMPETSFAVGNRVLVLGGERPFAAVITGQLSANEYSIKYFEFETEVALPGESLRHLFDADSLRSDEVTVGLHCQCKYSADQQYYDAVVTSITQYGYTVTYSQYGNSEEVPLEFLRPALAKQTPSKSNTAAPPKKTSLIAIPENLQILPTDTEEEKQRKKKKLKGINFKNKQIQDEEDSKKVQQSWQSFVRKGTKHSLSGIVKKSMFESSDDAHARVGVIGSGKGMTSFQDRKKHKFNENEVDDD